MRRNFSNCKSFSIRVTDQYLLFYSDTKTKQLLKYLDISDRKIIAQDLRIPLSLQVLC